MVKTGYISFITETGGGMNGDGNPIPVTKQNSAYFKCNLKTITREYQIYDSGQFRQAAFSIVIDKPKISSIDLEVVKEVQLQDNNQNDLGTFQMQRHDYFTLTNSIKIVV